MPESLFVGKGNLGLELIVFNSKSEPTMGTMHRAYKARKARRSAPVLVAVIHDEGVSLCGVTGDHPPVYPPGDVKQIEGLCKSALDQPDRNSAIRFLSSAMPSLETDLPGITNEGLLSLHELTSGTRRRNDWDNACRQAASVRGKSGKEMLHALGFNTEPLDNLTELLTTGKTRTAVAVLLKSGEIPETRNSRFNNTSPVSYALTKADKEGLSWVVMVQDNQVRLYNTENVGVGRRGRTETYIECQPALLSSDDIGLLWLLFSADALKKDGTITSILEESKRFAADVASKLRERIYDIVVPELATGIAEARAIKNPSKDDIDLTYQMALMVLFRLLFIAYAEDRDLLPYKGNEAYRKRSLKQKAVDLAETNQEISEEDYHHWKDTARLWNAISKGKTEWGVPAYNGTMFSSKRKESPAGAELAKITLPDTVFVEVLQNLLLTSTDDNNYAPVDFRSLSVREFGTIYEGLLESELSQAEQNLTINNEGTYLPADKSKKIAIRKGEIYLHDRSGARKSSGSYYTKDFVVEHLLDGALEPALDEHLDRMKKLDDADRSEQFFDFRVADIAMGSGHFLVAAVDHIERRFALWLEDNPTPGITRELQYLREAAKKALGELADQVTIEDGQLLRRMIARRCIYGIDINPLAVQLAQLSIWIHTFVPGLPLSLLDHNLVHGNALVGVGSMDEIHEKSGGREDTPLFEPSADDLLGSASEPLRKLAKLSDASVKDIDAGRKLIDEVRKKTQEAKTLCDLITIQPMTEDARLKDFWFEDWDNQKASPENRRIMKLAQEILEPLSALHFPIAFPEVFLGRSQGFDVILGNPPWEEVKAEERDFWTGLFPGLRGLPQREQMKQWAILRKKRPDLEEKWNNIEKEKEGLASILKTGNFPGLEVGDLDLYKAFAWRFWFTSAKNSGKIGVVLPRSAINAKGSENFRRELFGAAGTMDITTLQNTGGWVFDMEPRYTIALIAISKNTIRKASGISLKGPFTSRASFTQDILTETCRFTAKEVLNWNESASLPLLPTPHSTEVFAQLRKAPSLNLNKPGQWRARPDRELDASLQKHMMDFNEDCPRNFWPVYKGASFELWNPDTGEYYAWGTPKIIRPWLYDKRLKAHGGTRDSVHREFSRKHVEDKTTLAPLHPRIAFRLITNRTNRRTMVCSLTPPNVFHANSSQVIVMPRGDRKDEAFLLGVLSSIPLDWYARLFVEINFNFFLFNPLPIPRPKRSNPLWKRVVQLSGRLACPDKRFARWAAEVGVECGQLTPDDKQDKIHELDAVVAHLYGLSEKQLVHIFKTFHEGWNHEDYLREVLHHYQAWRKKLL